MRILLVDDDAEIRFLAGFVLERAGHDVALAESGAEGLRAATEGQFDVVLVDYRLGDMTGGRLLTALLEEAPGRPVVFLTGQDDASIVAALRASGAADVLTKPFDPETLAARVGTIVREFGRDSTGAPS